MAAHRPFSELRDDLYARSPEAKERVKAKVTELKRKHRSLGARLGNWNDRHSTHDRRADASLRWRLVDRIASWLYVRGW